MAPDLPNINLNSRSLSGSRSRAASPLRIFQPWSAGLHCDRTVHHVGPAEERFVPVNLFKRRTHIRLSWSWCCPSSSSPADLDLEKDVSQVPFSGTSPSSLGYCSASVSSLFHDIVLFSDLLYQPNTAREVQA